MLSFNLEIEEMIRPTVGTGGGGGSPPEVRRITKVSFDASDVVAWAGGLVAVLIAAGMLSQLVPVNAYTVGIVSFSGAGVVIAKIIQAQSSTSRKKRKA
jgi:hypothetical protein